MDDQTKKFSFSEAHEFHAAALGLALKYIGGFSDMTSFTIASLFSLYMTTFGHVSPTQAIRMMTHDERILR